MLREFTVDIGRFKKGESRDYPNNVWTSMSETSGKKLDDFTKAVPNPVLQNMHRPLKRMGT